ncbi:FAD:protein FMN transferase [Streptococcus didelphis]|uniref:FAD:protein FMN transferase n=1 Tax=Streptococcus didelphis TaxID=102886 RepID=UPI00037729BE|nr:FAD:protein FMN transferase [Streptococcus didelphis]
MFVNHHLKMMGTLIDIQIDSSRANQQLATVCQLFEEYNKRFSANDETSELMEINQVAGKKPVLVHPDLYELIKIGKEHSLAVPSNLNIAIGPLVQSWRIGFPDASLPNPSLIKDKLSLTSCQNILLDDKKQTVYLEKKGMKLDLGALAKGYIADKIMGFLIKDGIQSALLNLGGNVLVHGENTKRKDKHFYVGIQEPGKKRGDHLGVLKVQNQSVVTSGIYERQFKLADQTYHHIFDRQTGYSIKTDMASLTIVADTSLDCEIWTSRLFGLDTQTVYQFLNELPNIEGVIITKDKKALITQGLQKKFQFSYH